MFAGQCPVALATAFATGVPIDPTAPPPIPVGLLTTPLFHVTANNCGAYALTAAGGKIVLMYRWDAGEALRLIEQEKVSAMSGVPVMAREVINHPDFARRDTSSLLSLAGGGAQLPPDLVGKIDEAVATARPGTGYGLTETCGIITSVSADFFVNKPDSAGPVMPDFEYKCVEDDGQAVADGLIGELWVRGAQVIKGYLNRPEATAEAITNGWFHTGDIARVDTDGFLYIVDRKKDMILRGGENIYCAEVEATAYRHPSIAECSGLRRAGCAALVRSARPGGVSALYPRPGAIWTAWRAPGLPGCRHGSAQGAALHLGSSANPCRQANASSARNSCAASCAITSQSPRRPEAARQVADLGVMPRHNGERPRDPSRPDLWRAPRVRPASAWRRPGWPWFKGDRSRPGTRFGLAKGRRVDVGEGEAQEMHRGGFAVITRPLDVAFFGNSIEPPAGVLQEQPGDRRRPMSATAVRRRREARVRRSRTHLRGLPVRGLAGSTDCRPPAHRRSGPPGRRARSAAFPEPWKSHGPRRIRNRMCRQAQARFVEAF